MYFILGIKGIAMANLAVLLKQSGHDVYGVDVAEEFITDDLLQKHGISYSTVFKPSSIPNDSDFFVYSAAHNGTANPLSLAAKKRNIILISQTELLDNLMSSDRIKVAVSGCHGKTTTSSLLSYALKRLNKNPGYLVGVPDFSGYDGTAIGDGSYFVVEADEYGIDPPRNLKPKFLNLHPDYIVCTNIDFDHPDVYKNLEETKNAFRKFFDSKKIIVCQDDLNLMLAVSSFPRKQYTTYGFSEQSDYIIKNPVYSESKSSFELYHGNHSIGLFSISLFGEKNIDNATACIIMLFELGFGANEIAGALIGFSGAQRRFEMVYENKKNHIKIFDDYAHHPSEIQATVDAVKKRFPSKRIIVIFQPHTYSRTKSLLHEFSRVFLGIDKAYILPIFASARENESEFSISSEDIVKLANSEKYQMIHDKNELMDNLKEYMHPGDIVFTMGAGDVYKLKIDIIKAISYE